MTAYKTLWIVLTSASFPVVGAGCVHMGYICQLLGRGFSSDIGFKIVAVFPSSSSNEDFKIIIICLLIPGGFRRD